MDLLDRDLNESDLFCKSLIHKRKAVENDNCKASKQLKLNFTQTINKDEEQEKKDDNNSVAGKMKAYKNSDLILKSPQSQSGYFHVKKSVNTCPLCLKSFRTDSIYSAHMKQCAKTHKMTTQQLLGALELQKKQIQERKELGLCSQGVLPQKKSAPKKGIEKCKDSYDLALGLALSKSLTSDESRTAALPDAPKSTLKEFGFTSLSSGVGTVAAIKRKSDGDKRSLLKQRTEEDRQRIIIEKVAVVLLDEDKEQKMECKKENPGIDFQNIQVPELWSKGENNCKSGWYVPGIKGLVLSGGHSGEEFTEPTVGKFQNEVVKLNLPQKDVSSDWRKIINNEKLSDFVGNTRDGQDVFLHSVVLYARCPELLEKNFKAIFEKFNLSTVLIFMEYLYCGTLNGLCGTEIEDLYKLAIEFNYNELIQILKCLKDNLSSSISPSTLNFSSEVKHEDKSLGITMIHDEKVEILKDKDEDIIDLTVEACSPKRESEDSSNAEKSFWSFIQHQKRVEKLEDVGSLEGRKKPLKDTQREEEKKVWKSSQGSDKTVELRRLSDDSTTKDWNDILFEKENKTSSDCVILSSGSEAKSEENFIKSEPVHPGTPSPINVNYEVPLFDPYDNFHCFSEEPFSPVGLLSQSLISGDISIKSPKENSGSFDIVGQEEPKKPVAYCSTPVTARGSAEVDLSVKKSQKSRRKRCDPSSSRLLRKSLGLQQKRRSKSSSFNRKRKDRQKGLAETLTNSVLNELAKYSALEASTPGTRNFIEITPVSNKEFADSVTPSPNYSNMEEALLKEQLSKYGLKKNLAKGKAKKILRLIYEELHPLYNPETGKIVKMLPRDAPKGEKNSKPAAKSKKEKVKKPKENKSVDSGKKLNGCLNFSKESDNLSDGSIFSVDRSSERTSGESDFESLNETLTQSLPTNPMDLPSAFSEFLRKNADYHQKILLYEPIWLEDLQKKLKEHFKKHVRMSDLTAFLDQKCIAFRSVAQAKKLQKRFQKRKENLRNTKKASKGNSS